MAEKKRIGDVLKEEGLVDDFQIQSALAHQKNWGGKIGAILIEMGFIREEDMVRGLAEALRIPYVDLFEPAVLPGVIKLVKADVAKKYQVMPARKEGTQLVLAMADPIDFTALDEIRFITGLSITPALATGSEISDAIRKYYDREEVVRTKRPVELAKSQPTGEMEIIRESEMKIGSEWLAPEEPAQHPSEPPASPAQSEAVADRLLIDAITTLLIEKELMTREELMHMLEQKKLGL